MMRAGYFTKGGSVKKLASAMAFVMLLAASAFAGDLVNKDSSSYDIEVSCGGGTTHTSINGNTTQSGRAGKGCTIKIKGGDSITAGGDKDVIIKDGKLSER
jgi:hypothetical protein